MKHNGEHQGNGGSNPNVILAEIERTREEMDSTLTAIEQRLTPGQLVDQGIDYLRNSGANEFVQNLGGQVKTNPMPVALVGIGVAWLMATGRKPQQQSSGSMSGYMARAGEKTGELRDQASGMAQSAKDRMNEGKQALRDKVSEAKDRVSSMTDTARTQMERVKGGMDYMMREQPLALGAIGVAIGALLAAMAPRTRQEDQLMGETRDRLMDQAKDAGKEKIEQVKEVANAAVGAAQSQQQTPAKPDRGSQPPAPAIGPKPPTTSASEPRTTVGVHHSFGDAPTQTVPPTPAKPSITPKPGGNPGGSRNPR
jgi:ElaB/YqjD/DUF883 family membrane-anchored ribosome-binding protein